MPEGLYDKDTGGLNVPPGMAVHLARIGYEPSEHDQILDALVPQRTTHTFALHPDHWKGTFWSLTGKDPHKITAYRPELVPIVPGTLVADMLLANRFQRSGDPEAAQDYADSVMPLDEADLSHYRYPELLIPKSEASLGSSTIDLRDHFGIWNRCGNSRFFSKENPHSKIYLNPLNGILLVAHGTPLRDGTVKYEMTVRDAEKAVDGEIEEAYKSNYPWVKRAVMAHFYMQAIGWANDAVKEYYKKDLPPGDADMWNFLQAYPSIDRYRNEGRPPEEGKLLREETLEAIYRTISNMKSTIVDYGRDLSEEEVDAAFAEAGILEC